MPRNRIIIGGLRAITLVVDRDRRYVFSTSLTSATPIKHANIRIHTCLSCRYNDSLWFSSFAVYANAIDPHLEILPSGDLQTKPIGSSIILTCKPKVDNPMLVEDMQWLDPQNRVIESLK